MDYLNVLKVVIDLGKQISPALVGRLGIVLHSINCAIVFIHRTITFANRGTWQGIGTRLGFGFWRTSKDSQQKKWKKNNRGAFSNEA
jgi:hypothetical protein